MVNEQLNIFIAAADCGSFHKAGEKLFLSATAVMKQINQLERRIGVPLVERTARGIRLTSAGEQFYQDAKFMIAYSAEAISRIRKSANDGKDLIKVGTSVLNPCKPLMDLWGQVSDVYARFKINVVPFEDDHNNILTVIGDLGKRFDCIVGACDAPQWLARCNFFKLGEYQECVAVPRNHRLAAKKSLQLSDLHGEKLRMVKKGVSSTLDRLHEELKQHPQILLEETSFYDIDVFNACAQEGGVMLTLDAWAEVHPLLVTLPMEWDYAIPYGIMYPLHPSGAVTEFLDAIKGVIK